jgi:hypothetical protein
MTIEEALKIYKECSNNFINCNCNACQLSVDGDNDICRTLIHLEVILKLIKDGK